MKRGLFAILALLPAGTAQAQGAAPHIWAVPGLYGLERSACEVGGAKGPDTAMVAPLFCPMLDLPHRQRIGAHFAAAMAARFPGVEARFGASLPADATPRARLGATLVASLRLTRATRWTIAKRAGIDAYLPITLTLDITNAATGEVLFTRTRSEIFQGTFGPTDLDEGLRAQFEGRLEAVMDALVTAAAAEWKPRAQQATVVAREGDTWIVDLGRTAGLRAGDMLGADGRVLYAGASYAVVKPVLESYRSGQTLSRTVASAADSLAKPTVLSVMAAVPQGYSASYLGQIVEDALGTRGGFAPVPVNPGFANLRAMALGEAQAPALESRSLPDYVAHVSVETVDPVHFVSNVPGVTVERHEAHAFISLVDRTGRVVAAWHGLGHIEDQVSAGMGFSPDQRRDTVVRNALIDAARQMATFRPQPLTLAVTRQDKAIVIADPNGALPSRVQLTVLRPVGSKAGIKDPVLVPVGEIETGDPVAGGLSARDAGVQPIALQRSDVVAIESTGTAALTSRRPLIQCANPDGSGRTEDRGQHSFPLWQTAGGAGFAGHYGGPVHVRGLAERLSSYDAYFAGWNHFAPALARSYDACFTPVVAVVPAPAGYRVTAGYTLFAGDRKLAGSGLQLDLTPTRLPPGTAAADVEAMLQQDLAARTIPLAEKVAATLRLPD